MHIKFKCFLIVLVVALDISSMAIAQMASSPSDTIKKIAQIMHRLKHFPSPAGKQTLQELIDHKSSNKNEKIIAQAMLNLNHRATQADQAKLKLIMSSQQASDAEKTIANIVYFLDHRPTKNDKEKLKKLME